MHSVPSNTPSTLAEADRQQHNQLLRGLIRDAAHGDTRAFESIYRLTSRWVLARVRRLTGDSLAEDVMAEVYLQVWRSLAAFDPARGDPMPWLMTIARSRALDRLRAERSSHGGTSYDAHASQPEEASHRDGPEQMLELAQSRASVQACLSTLAAKEQLVLAMAYYGDLSHSEISASTGLPLGSVKTLMRRSQEKLRVALQPAPAVVQLGVSHSAPPQMSAAPAQ